MPVKTNRDSGSANLDFLVKYSFGMNWRYKG